MKELNKPKDVAKIIGVSYSDLMQSLQTGDLGGVEPPKYIKAGRFYYFTKDSVEKYISHNIIPQGDYPAMERNDHEVLRKSGHGIIKGRGGDQQSIVVFNFNGNSDRIIYNHVTKKAMFDNVSKLLPWISFNSVYDFMEFFEKTPLGKQKPNITDKQILDRQLKSLGLTYKDINKYSFFDKAIFDAELAALVELSSEKVIDGKKYLKKDPEKTPSNKITPLSAEEIFDSFDHVIGGQADIKFSSVYVSKRLILGCSYKNEKYNISIFELSQNGYGYFLAFTYEGVDGHLMLSACKALSNYKYHWEVGSTNVSVDLEFQSITDDDWNMYLGEKP